MHPENVRENNYMWAERHFPTKLVYNKRKKKERKTCSCCFSFDIEDGGKEENADKSVVPSVLR